MMIDRSGEQRPQPVRSAKRPESLGGVIGRQCGDDAAQEVVGEGGTEGAIGAEDAVFVGAEEVGSQWELRS